MLFNQYTNSLANPVLGSAVFSFGTKPTDAFMTYSVGTQGGVGGYLTKNSDGDDVTATIEDGIITFSFPQHNSYVGVGDVVSFASGPDVYLNKKITPDKWHVKLSNGGIVPDVSDPVVVNSLDKAFNSIYNALDDSIDGIETLLGTKDLRTLGFHVRVACYEMTDNLGANTVDIRDWAGSEQQYLYIYTPIDIQNDCNKRQRYLPDGSGGYKITGTAGLIETRGLAFPQIHYIAYDGLFLDNASNFQNGIESTSPGPGLRILNCRFKDGKSGVQINSVNPDDTIVNCTFSGFTEDALHDPSGDAQVYGSTFVSNVIGIKFGNTSSQSYVNCIFKDSPFDGTVGAFVENCASNDGTVTGGTNVYPNSTLQFIDEAGGDFRLHPSDSDAYLNAKYMENDSHFPYITDSQGDPYDDTYCMGVSHYIPTTYFAIGNTADDYKTGTPNLTVTDSVITFSVAQTDERLCAGCKVEGSGFFAYLKQRIDDSNWIVVSEFGENVSNQTSIAVTTISPVFDTMRAAIENDGSGEPGISTEMTYGDLTTLDVAVVITPTDGSDSLDAVMDTVYLITDKTRNIKIYAPNKVGIDCNVSRRHSGIWNGSLYRMLGSFPITVTLDYTEVDGLQFDPITTAVLVSDGESIKISNNIIRNASDHAILWDNNVPGDRNVIVNNLIYNCGGHGVDIVHNFGHAASAKDGAPGDNQWQITAYEKSARPNSYRVVVKPAFGNKIVWSKESVVIEADTSTSSPGQVFNGPVEGEPWGFLESLSDVSPMVDMDWKKISEMDDFSPGASSGEFSFSGFKTNSYFFIYSNTIFNCDRGIFVESLIDEPHTNIASIKNNLIQNCPNGSVISTTFETPTIGVNSNFADDDLFSKFNGDRNIINQTVDFTNVAIEDFHISLQDSIKMLDVSHLSADPYYQVELDFEGEDRGDSYKWDIGADNYNFRNQGYVDFSVGSAPISVSGRVLIKNSILTIVDATIDNNMGVGDKITFFDGLSFYSFYLAERGNDTTWLVKDENGDPFFDVSVEYDITSSQRVFATLADAINGTAASTGLYTELGLSSVDLVTNGLNATLWCYDDSDDPSVVAISGWTLDKDHQISILSPWNNSQAIETQRHSGKWGPGYKLTATTSPVVIDVNNSWVFIEGIQIVPSTPTEKGVLVRAASEGVTLAGLIVKDSSNAIEQEAGGIQSNCVNNIVYDSVNGIIWDNGPCYNNDAVNTTTAGFNLAATVTAINNLSQKTSGDDFLGAATLSYCISGDATAGTSDFCRSNVAIKFEDKDGKDFHLHRTDWPALNRGLELKYDALFPFNRDVDMEFILGDWSIGADSRPGLDVLNLYFSCGKDTSDFSEGISLRVTVAGGVAQFTDDQDNAGVGVGVEVDYDVDNKKGYLVRKVDKDKSLWVIVDKYGMEAEAADNVVVNSISHPFNDLAAAIGSGAGSIGELIGDANNPFRFLSSYKAILNIAMYRNPTPHADEVIIENYDVNEDCYINIYTPVYEDLDCNAFQDHNGVFGNPEGYALIQRSGTGGNCITCRTDYTKIIGLNINGTNQDNQGVVFDRSTDCVLGYNMVYGCAKGIDSVSRYFSDNFEGGVKNSFWDSEFQDPNWPLSEPYPGFWVATDDDPNTIDQLTSPSSLIGGRFEYNFDMYMDIDTGNTSLKFYVSSAPSTHLAIVRWVGGLLYFGNTLPRTQMPFVQGRTYQFKLVRGGTVTPSGVFVEDGNLGTIRLYYFDDFTDGSGTGTNTWIEDGQSPYDGLTTLTDDHFIQLEGADHHGFSKFELWAESGLPSGSGASSTTRNIFLNNIMWANFNAISPSGDDIVYNCTIDESSAYAVENDPLDIIVNVISQGAVSGSFLDNSTIEYCSADDLTPGSERNNRSSAFLAFENELSRNYNLTIFSSDARGVGKNLRGDLLYSFILDATRKLNRERKRFWDRGALEYLPQGTAFYSVGLSLFHDVDFKTGSPTFSIEDSVITFSEPQNNIAIGVGDKVKWGTSFSEGYILSEKISDTQWRVVEFNGDTVSGTPSGNVLAIQRAFDTLSTALSSSYGIFSYDYLNNFDLTSAQKKVNIACYDDESMFPTLPYMTDEYPFEFLPYVSDTDYYIRIFTPYNTDTECNSNQRHVGKIDSGYKIVAPGYLDATLYPPSSVIGVYAGDYLEIEGLIIINEMTANQSRGIGFDSQIRSVLLENNVFKCTGDAIYQQTPSHSLDVIVNNLIFGSGLDGISVGADSAAESVIRIYNNTIVDRRRGVYFRHGTGDDSPSAIIKNNLVQDSNYQDYVEQNIQVSGKVEFLNCISSDDSALLFGGSGNQGFVDIEFSDRASDNYNLKESVDTKAIDNALDLSSDGFFPFNYDIALRLREPELWDIGAFELVKIICFGADLEVGPLSLDVFATAGEDAYAKILYLREDADHYKDGVDINVQFLEIGDPVSPAEGTLNYYLAENEPVDNLIIYAQGGIEFPGTMELQDRGSRTALIATDPDELSDGPASIVYPVDGPAVGDTSAQGKLTFENIKIYSADGGTHSEITGSNTSFVSYVNSIVQSNYNALVNLNYTLVDVLNSTLVFFNLGSNTDIRLTNNFNLGHSIANSMIIMNDSQNALFSTNASSVKDNAYNLLTYNYGSGTLAFESFQQDKIFDSQENIDPLLVEMTTDWSVVSAVMAQDFLPRIDSTLVDAGRNIFVTGIDVDIIGNARIYDSWIVDIGPYELQVNKITFDSKDIQSIFQDKLRLNTSDRTYIPESGDAVYRDLYNQFIDNPGHREEFVRESKIIIKLKTSTPDYRVFTDKIDIEVASFEAYYDVGSRSIIMDKPGMLYGKMLSTLFDDGRFIFRFDEVQSRVTAYLSHTYDKGLSGVRNVVNKVRFGGTSIISG